MGNDQGSKDKYSAKEQAMFEALGFSDLMCHVDIPPTLYDIAGLKCFVEGTEGPAVESLRRCLKALKDGWGETGEAFYRMTPEFDNLIDLG